MHEANKCNGSANTEIPETSESAKTEEQASLHKRELALDLRFYMNRAPVTVSWAVRSECLISEITLSIEYFA